MRPSYGLRHRHWNYGVHTFLATLLQCLSSKARFNPHRTNSFPLILIHLPLPATYSEEWWKSCRQRHENHVRCVECGDGACKGAGAMRRGGAHPLAPPSCAHVGMHGPAGGDIPGPSPAPGLCCDVGSVQSGQWRSRVSHFDRTC